MLTAEIFRAWRAPRVAMRRQLAHGVREDRALLLLMLACLVIFVAQWPRLARESWADPAVPLEARIGAALLGIMFIAPLAFYALAAVSHLIARAVGGKGTFATARLALFWSLLVVSPGFLLHGLAQGFLGAQTRVAGLLLLAVFLVIWFFSLLEAERPPPQSA